MRTTSVLIAATAQVLFLGGCGKEDTGGSCQVDCSEWGRRIDVTTYGNISKGDCAAKGTAARCRTLWSKDGTCEVVYPPGDAGNKCTWGT